MSLVNAQRSAGFQYWLHKIKLFLGLSRTSHALLDVATPAMAALIYLGHFPNSYIIVVGLITAFAGYTAVYALNDIVDIGIDRQRLSLVDKPQAIFDVDEVFVQHPLAQGLISPAHGMLWFGFWALIALIGAWLLNTYCAILFVISACLELIYCKLLKITHFKIIPSALVKASGGVAGVLAVDPEPSMGFIVVLILWLAAWEVGGQNIPNDIVDMENDSKVDARTTLTVRGLDESVFFLVTASGMAAFGGIVIYFLAGEGLRWLYIFGATFFGYYLIVKPAKAVYDNPTKQTAGSLFNRASYMPLMFLLLAAVSCA